MQDNDASLMSVIDRNFPLIATGIVVGPIFTIGLLRVPLSVWEAIDPAADALLLISGSMIAVLGGGVVGVRTWDWITGTHQEE